MKRKSRPQTLLLMARTGCQTDSAAAVKTVAGKNQQVVGSSPSAGSIFLMGTDLFFRLQQSGPEYFWSEKQTGLLFESV